MVCASVFYGKWKWYIKDHTWAGPEGTSKLYEHVT